MLKLTNCTFAPFGTRFSQIFKTFKSLASNGGITISFDFDCIAIIFTSLSCEKRIVHDELCSGPRDQFHVHVGNGCGFGQLFKPICKRTKMFCPPTNCSVWCWRLHRTCVLISMAFFESFVQHNHWVNAICSRRQQVSKLFGCAIWISLTN